jgi:Rhodanese-like domain
MNMLQTQIWPVLHSALMDAGLRSISTEEVRIWMAVQVLHSGLSDQDEHRSLLQLTVRVLWLQAKALADKGAVFVDIRTPKDFGKEHIPGAVNVPMFVPVVGTKMFDQIKKVVMATAFAMTATGARIQSQPLHGNMTTAVAKVVYQDAHVSHRMK